VPSVIASAAASSAAIWRPRICTPGLGSPVGGDAGGAAPAGSSPLNGSPAAQPVRSTVGRSGETGFVRSAALTSSSSRESSSKRGR